MLRLEALGLSTTMLQQVSSLGSKSSGFFGVTGPTRSGKTTTIYALLSTFNESTKNIITLEDPVEYNIAGITQGQINPAVGFTFERGIRAMLRQDPDVVMVGEVRDKQTAQIAIEAALTGHTVLSTLHTQDAPGAIMRLMDMNIEPFLINAAVTGVLAQRLVKKLCNGCKVEHTPTPQEKELLKQFDVKIDTLYESTGCDNCFYIGHKGRIGIFQLLPMSSALRSLIIKQPCFDDICAQAARDGMLSLYQDGIAKVISGQIALDELVRVVL
jgi:type II secretory ATPase GspE/PulE/Tfp pilus assembly ATPase PilB-like protein